MPEEKPNVEIETGSGVVASKVAEEEPGIDKVNTAVGVSSDLTGDDFDKQPSPVDTEPMGGMTPLNAEIKQEEEQPKEEEKPKPDVEEVKTDVEKIKEEKEVEKDDKPIDEHF